MVFTQQQAARSGGDIHQHTACAVQADVIQQRAGNGLFSGNARAIQAGSHGRAHHRHAHLAHHVLDVGKVDVDEARAGNHFSDAGHGAAQHIVSGAESLAHGHIRAQHLQQLLVGDDDQRIDVFFQFFDARAGHLVATAFVRERTGDHTDGQNAHFLGDFGNHRCGAGTGAAAHAGGDEHHIGAAQHFSDAVAVFDGGAAADIRVGACAQALGQGLADLNLHRRTVAAQGLGVGIGGDEFNALDLAFDHVIDGIAATTPDANHLDDGFGCDFLHHLKDHVGRHDGSLLEKLR